MAASHLSASYEWFVQLVEPLADRVVLAHPGKLRVIAETTRNRPADDTNWALRTLVRDSCAGWFARRLGNSCFGMPVGDASSSRLPHGVVASDTERWLRKREEVD